MEEVDLLKVAGLSVLYFLLAYGGMTLFSWIAEIGRVCPCGDTECRGCGSRRV